MNNEKRVSLFGFDFLNLPNEEAAAHFILENPAPPGKFPVVCTPNAAQIVGFEESPELKGFFQKSGFILPDGQPLVWLSQLIGDPLKARITGSGMFPFLWNELRRRDERVLIVNPSEEIGHFQKKEFPDCVVVPAPVFSNREEVETWAKTLESKIESERIRFVILGLGFPKQEWICQTYFERNPDSPVIFLLLGASSEYYFGVKKRAPGVWQKANLEWLYRFLQEPRRLWHRYTVVNFQFLVLFFNEWRSARNKRKN